MSDDLIPSKIALLEEQIENFERSGFFTEKEIDRFTSPLYTELEILRVQLWNCSQFGHLAALHLEKAVSGLSNFCAKIHEVNEKFTLQKINDIKVIRPEFPTDRQQ